MEIPARLLSVCVQGQRGHNLRVDSSITTWVDKGKGKRLAGEGVVQANEKRPRSNGAAAAGAAVDESPRVEDTPQPKGAVGDQLSSHVVNLHQSLADFQGWMESRECAASTLGALKNSLGKVLEQMKQNSGKSVIFVGNNGV
eukprot:606172-Rhodomonas_salina.1